MPRSFFKRSLFAFVLPLAACGGGGGGSGTPAPGDSPPPIISFTHIFPQGDATAAKGVAWDIVAVKTTLSGQYGVGLAELYDTLRVDVTFAQDISHALPNPGADLAFGNQLGVGIAFDTDVDVHTGGYNACDQGSGVAPFEFLVSTDPRLSDGNYSILYGGAPIFTGGPNPPEEAITSVSGHVFTQSFFLPALSINSGSAVPNLGFNVAVINGLALESDCVPSATGELHTDRQ